MLTNTQLKAFESFKTPTINNPIWDRNPDPAHEDPDDKKTPSRLRTTAGDCMVLVETVHYRVFPTPEQRAAMKAKGKKPKPMWHHRIYIHLAHTKFLWVRTLKVYKHQGEWFYADGGDYEIETSKKSGPAKDRASLVAVLARLIKASPEGASSLLSEWTKGL